MSKLFGFLLIVGFGFFNISPVLATEEKHEFERVNRIIIDAYSPEVANLRAKVELEELFDNFGGAFRVGSVKKAFGEDRFIITLTGEVVKGPAISPGHAIMACHEMGHLFGGAPFQSPTLVKWSSVEGQADYFATGECMWRYVESVKSRIFIHDYDAEWINKCQEHFEGEKKVVGCLRILSGIQAVANFFNLNKQPEDQVSLDKKDPTIVSVTRQKYGSDQCRIQTMVDGLFQEPRPSCWYKE